MNRRCVSFLGNDKRGCLVAGNVDLHIDDPIASIDDIREIQQCISSMYKLNHVAVINIIQYEDC